MKKEIPQVDSGETSIILDYAKKCLLVEGDFVEFGCYRGDTSLLLQEILDNHNNSIVCTRSKNQPDTSKRLYIYDSFEGLPEKSSKDSSTAGDQFRAGELFVSKKFVVDRFKKANLSMPMVKKGFFDTLNPETDVPSKISFGFLDGDLYDSIRVSLDLTSVKMAPGGFLIIHDYNNPKLPGVAKVVEEFMRKHQYLKLKHQRSLAIISF